MKLRRNEYCPIHRSLFCCGREQANKQRQPRLGVQRIEDPHHPRGYRELRSPAEMRKLLNRKVAEQGGKCGICHEPFTDCGEIVPDHIEPRGMGAARRDDHPDNIQAVHRLCNGRKGSSRTGDTKHRRPLCAPPPESRMGAGVERIALRLTSRQRTPER